MNYHLSWKQKKSGSLSTGLKLPLTKREYPYTSKVKEPLAIIFSFSPKIEMKVSDGLETFL